MRWNFIAVLALATLLTGCEGKKTYTYAVSGKQLNDAKIALGIPENQCIDGYAVAMAVVLQSGGGSVTLACEEHKPAPE